MLTKTQITFIKGYLFKELGIALNLSVKEVDKEIKEFLEIEKISELDNDGFMQVSIHCFKLGDKLGLNLNFPNNEWNKIYDNKDETKEV